MPPDKNKIKIGLNFLIDVIKNNTEKRLVIALDTETTGLKIAMSEITWISWSVGNHYGAIPIRHRNHVSSRACQQLNHSCSRSFLRTFKLCRCHQGRPNKTTILPHKFRNICKNDDEENVKKVLQDIHYSDNKHRVIWHNSGFDLSLLASNGWLDLSKIQAEIFDTLLASYNLNPIKVKELGRGSHGLKFLHDSLLRESVKSERQPEFESICNGRAFQDVPLEDAAYYATFDAWSTFKLYERFEKEIAADKKLSHYFYCIECPHTLTTAEIISSGMQVHTSTDAKTAGLESTDDILSRIALLKIALFRLLGFSFNLESPDSLRGALFRRQIGIQPLGRGAKSGKHLTDKGTFSKILRLEKSKINRSIIAHVMQIKRLTETVKKHNEINKYRNPRTGRVNPNFTPTTATGRYSASRPNILSLPGSSDLKKHFVASPGNVLVVADFSQIDLRGIANETGELDIKSKMLADVNSGADLHLATLKIVYPGVPKEWKRIFEDKETKELMIELMGGGTPFLPIGDELEKAKLMKQRRGEIAKQVNFGIAYGLGATGLLESLNNPDEFDSKIFQLFDKNMDVEEWQKLIENSMPKKHSIEDVYTYLQNYHLAYPGIKQFQEMVETELKTRGFTYNMFGKKCKVAVASHFDVGVFDVELGFDKWFRVRLKKLRIDGDYIYGELIQVNKIVVCEPTNKRKIELKDLIRKEGFCIYKVDADELRQALTDFQSNNDCSKLSNHLREIHENASCGAEEFFRFIHAIPPELYDSALGRTVIIPTVPCFPFVRIPHHSIKYVRVGNELDLFYSGYDSCRRELISYRIQSTSMDICKIAMTEFRRKVSQRSHEWKTRPIIVNCVHDEIVVECHQEDCSKITDLLQASMQDKEVFDKFVLPDRKLLVEIRADVGFGPNYREAKPK